MKRSRFRPAFVLTLAAAPGCAHAPAHTPDTTATTATTATVATTATTATPPAGPRTRPVANAEQRWNPYKGMLDLNGAKQLNPRDAQGRPIQARPDGHCYVDLPFPAGEPIPPPGSASPSKVVDCPDAMQDPAWDTCFNGPLYKLTNGDCVCLLGGNPPPPPLAADCPADSARDTR